MKKHTKVFLEARGFGGHTEVPNLMCEWCFSSEVVDIHHVKMKGMGGNKNLDTPENLIGLCRSCHNKAHGIGGIIHADDLSERVELIRNVIRNT